MNKLNQIHREIAKKEKERHDILHREIDKFKGKFFKNKEEDVVKISIFKVETTNWDNAVEYTRCYYCQDERGSWWKIDDKQDFEYSEYDLEKLKEAIEISQDEYEKKRDVIIEQARHDEVDEIRIKYNELKQDRFK